MSKKISYLGIIPARGGSKAIPRKNIKKIAGKPLIAWTIESAKQSKLLTHFVVSTEDKEIADISREHGAEVNDRSSELATDDATTLSVLQDVLTKIEADAIVLLQPTSPIRDDDLIDRCIQRFEEMRADCLGTGFMCKYYEYGTYNQRRQDMNGFFYDDGNVYIINSDLIRQGTRFGGKAERVVISREENVEIDDDFEFWLVEQILIKRQKKKIENI